MRAATSWGIETVGLVCIAVLLIACPVLSFQANETKAPLYPVPVKVLEVKDGDTITADILLPWAITIREQAIRENSFDAWESSKRRQSEAAGVITDAEVAKGKVATTALKAMLEGADVYLEPTRSSKSFGERDVFGRVLGKLWIVQQGKWIDVGEAMTKLGHDRRSQ